MFIVVAVDAVRLRATGTFVVVKEEIIIKLRIEVMQDYSADSADVAVCQKRNTSIDFRKLLHLNLHFHTHVESKQIKSGKHRHFRS